MKLLGYVVCLCLLGMVAVTDAPAQSGVEPVSAFEFVESKEVAKQSIGKRTTEPVQRIVFNRDIRFMPVGKSLRITFPDGLQSTYTHTEKRILGNGDMAWKAENSDADFANFTIGKLSVFGTIKIKNRLYSISSINGQDYLIDDQQDSFQRDLSETDIVIADDFKYLSELSEQPTSEANNKLTPTGSEDRVVDVMVVYSDDFEAAFPETVTRINQMVSFTNDSFDRSGIDIFLNLVHAYKVALNDNEDNDSLLDKVRLGRAPFTSTPSLRNQFGADLVSVVTFGSAQGGLAFLGGSNESYGFSVVDVYSVSASTRNSDRIFAHELGHNFGSGHARASVNPQNAQPCGGGFTGFSCGFGNRSQGWGTIMSYFDPAPIGFRFSSTDSSCGDKSDACGIGKNSPNSADNRTSFNLTRDNVAAYRNPSSVDLSVVDLGLSSAIVNQGENLTANLTLRNLGNAASESMVTLRFLLSEDSEISSDDTLLLADQQQGIGAAGISLREGVFAVNAASGNYYLGVCVDAQANENRTVNNCSSGVSLEVLELNIPDLQAAEASVDDASLVAGDKFTVSFTLSNLGSDLMEPASVNFYRSLDGTISESDVVIAALSSRLLQSGESQSLSFEESAPGAAGTYWFGACAINVSNEVNTGNNCTNAAQVDVDNPAFPDLVAATPSIIDPNLLVNQPFSMTVQVTNQGSAAAEASTLRAFISDTATISRSDLQFSERAFAALAANDDDDTILQGAAPPAAGSYWLGFCVDVVAGELQTDNNCSAGIPIAVQPEPIVGDQYEDDNQLSDSTAISVASSQTHTISPIGDVDWYTFSILSQANIEIETSGADSFDTVLTLFDTGGQEIAADDDGGTGTYSKLSITGLAAGTYYFRINEFSDDQEIAAYTVTVSTFVPASGDSFEPDDQSVDASPIELNVAQSHSVLPAGDQDWATFDLNQIMDVEISTGGSVGADTRLWLYDTDLNELAFDDDGLASGFSQIKMESLAKGTYFILVNEYSDSNVIADYNILITANEPESEDQYEPDNSAAQAKLIEPTQPQRRSLVPANDEDWVKVEVKTDTELSVSTSPVAEVNGTGIFDTTLTLYDEKMEMLAFNDDKNGEDLFSSIPGIAVSKGTYYVVVRNFDPTQTIRAYELSLECSSECDQVDEICFAVKSKNGSAAVICF